MSGSSTPEYKTRASTQQPGGPNTTSADSRLLDAAETLVTLQSVSSRGQGNRYTRFNCILGWFQIKWHSVESISGSNRLNISAFG